MAFLVCDKDEVGLLAPMIGYFVDFGILGAMSEAEVQGVSFNIMDAGKSSKNISCTRTIIKGC